MKESVFIPRSKWLFKKIIAHCVLFRAKIQISRVNDKLRKNGVLWKVSSLSKEGFRLSPIGFIIAATIKTRVFRVGVYVCTILCTRAC